jgi:hypothetical protein
MAIKIQASYSKRGQVTTSSTPMQRPAPPKQGPPQSSKK